MSRLSARNALDFVMGVGVLQTSALSYLDCNIASKYLLISFRRHGIVCDARQQAGYTSSRKKFAHQLILLLRQSVVVFWSYRCCLKTVSVAAVCKLDAHSQSAFSQTDAIIICNRTRYGVSLLLRHQFKGLGRRVKKRTKTRT